jgi:DNA-binding NarL/FixJ family response regulator
MVPVRMKFSPNFETHSVLIYIVDRLAAEMTRNLAREAFPHATIQVANSVAIATHALQRPRIDLLITSVGSSIDEDILALILNCGGPSPKTRRVLVVTTFRDDHTLAILRDLHVLGVFDSASEEPRQLVSALQKVAAGSHHWSRSALAYLAEHIGPGSVFRRLTAFEQLILAAIGDGSDDQSAATSLGLSPATIATVRRDLHRKLDVRHRGELVRIAAQTGFVRFQSNSTLKPGFDILADAYFAKKHRRTTRLAA